MGFWGTNGGWGRRRRPSQASRLVAISRTPGISFRSNISPTPSRRRELYAYGQATGARAMGTAFKQKKLSMLQRGITNPGATAHQRAAFSAGFRRGAGMPGRNVGSFAGRPGQWVKGAGGRFVGSK